jgi:4-hydroxy-tetrahydrodipicolinate synthase
VAEPWGVWAATLTPIDTRLQIDTTRATEYYAELLEAGCDGVNILGTTGEAMSFGIDQRIALMEAVAAALPCDRVMAGTGAASLADTICLTRCAIDAGLRAALILPPFFFRDASNDGIVRFYDELLGAVPQSHGRLLLYNFPKMSGITFEPASVRRLLTELPGAFAGLKDSSNDRELQTALIAEFPALRVFPGSEAYLGEAVGGGAAGCISGTVALWPAFARRALLSDRASADMLVKARDCFTNLPLIPAMRHAVTIARHDDAWSNAMPPLAPLPVADKKTLERRLLALESLEVE